MTIPAKSTENKMSTNLKAGHSSYWLDDDIWDNNSAVGTDTKPAQNINKIIRLAAVRRAVSNFVSILSGKNVPVRFEGEDSYTDGNEVIIAADDNPKNFDVSVGLALHEASHILLTDFRWLRAMGRYADRVKYISDAYTATTDLHFKYDDRTRVLSTEYGQPIINAYFLPEIVDSIRKMSGDIFEREGDRLDETWAIHMAIREHLNHIKTIMNVLEDRRIDQYVYNNATGYRPYYNALYDKYFYTKEASKLLRFDPSARIPTIENYINRLIYHIHPDSDPDALPGLRAIIKEMDLSNIHLLGPEYDSEIIFDAFAYEMTPKIWQKANAIMAMIIKYVHLYAEYEKSNDNAEDGAQSGECEGVGPQAAEDGSDEGEPSTPSDMAPRAPQTPVTKQDTKYNPSKAEKEMNTAKGLVGGEVKKKKITKALAQSVQVMEEAHGEMVSVSAMGFNNINCMVTRNITEALLSEEWFPFSHGTAWISNRMVDAVAAGRRMGQILHQRLQVRNDPMTTRQTRLSSGKIERRLLANLGLDNTDVFYRSRTDKHKPVMLHLTIDASGSMSGKKFENTMIVATAMAYLSSKMDNVDCVISFRGGEKYPIVSVVFDSRRDNFRKWMKFAPCFVANGNTPEGLCFAATMELILESKGTHDVYFINFSDGMPGFLISENATMTTGPERYGREWYTNDAALEHTRKMVNTLRENGIKILSYYIADAGYTYESIKKNFSLMYGADAEFVDVSSVTNVLKTMNKLLMKR